MGGGKGRQGADWNGLGGLEVWRSGLEGGGGGFEIRMGCPPRPQHTLQGR